MDIFNLTRIDPWQSHIVCIQVYANLKALRLDYLATEIDYSAERDDQ